MRGRRGIVTIVAVAAIVLLDAWLVGLVLRKGASTADPGSDRVTAQTTPAGPSAGAAPAAPPAPPSPGSLPSADSSRFLLLGADGDLALRGVPGSCERGGAVLERSSDGGRSWAPVQPPAPALLRADVVGEVFSVVGLGDGCAAQMFESRDQGASWQAAGRPSWQLLPEEDRVSTPTGEENSPCRRSLDLDPITDKVAALLCGSGSVYLSEEDGSWSRREGVQGGLAVDFIDPLRGWAVANTERCGEGVGVLATDNGGLAWQERGCVEVPRDVALGLAFRDETNGLVVAGTTTYASGDGGRTWAPVP